MSIGKNRAVNSRITAGASHRKKPGFGPACGQSCNAMSGPSCPSGCHCRMLWNDVWDPFQGICE